MTSFRRHVAGKHLFCLAVLYLLWLPALLGQVVEGDAVGESQPEEEKPSVGLAEDILANWWNDYRRAKQSGDAEAREKAYQNFLELKRQDGSGIFELGAYLFLEEGFSDLRNKKYESARKEFHQSLELNPYLWPARMGLARIKRERDGDYGRFIHLNFEGFTRAFDLRNTYFSFDMLMWLLSNFLWVIFASFILMVAVFLVKYSRSFFVTTAAAFEHRGMKTLYAQLATSVVVVLPLLLGLNIVLAAGLYLALLFPFLEGREKHIGVLGYLGWVMVPLILLLMTNVNHGRGNPVLKAHLSQYYQGNHEGRIQALSALHTEGELANRTNLLLGKYYRLGGNLREAMDAFEKVPKSSKFYPLAQVNIGNLNVMAKEYQQAITVYKAAAGEPNPLPLALYNLSIVKAMLGSHEESESYRSQALRLDPKLAQYSGVFDNADDGLLLDAEPDPVSRVGEALLGKGNPILKGWYSRPELLFMAIAGVLLLLLGIFFVSSRNMRALAKPCHKCGMMFFISDSPNSSWCTQCVSLYIRKEDLPSDAKIKKSEQVQKYTKTKRWLANGFQFLLPGAKQLFRGHSLSGYFTLFIWVALLVFCFNPIENISHAFMHYFHWPSFWGYLCIAVTTVYWIIFGLRGIWQED